MSGFFWKIFAYGNFEQCLKFSDFESQQLCNQEGYHHNFCTKTCGIQFPEKPESFGSFGLLIKKVAFDNP